MIACVEPADYHSSESIGTLQYANRALNIKNKAIINEDKTAKVVRLKADVQVLRVKLLEKSEVNNHA